MLVRLLLVVLAGLGASWTRIVERHPTRLRAADDIGWEDGESGDPADRN